MKKLLFLLILLPLFSACKEQRIVYIAAHKAACQGEAPQQCLLVKEKPESDWTNFYDTIEGFTHEDGYEYKLEVEITKIENPPADGSSLKYTLKKILSKTKQTAPIKIAYSAISRGFNLSVTLEKNKCLVVQSGVASKPRKQLKKVSNWALFEKMVNAIDLDNISSLKAPSDNRFFDGAATAELVITVGKKTYTSSAFDNGNPPQELKALVDELSAYVKD